jgi:hypothetical protein
LGRTYVRVERTYEQFENGEKTTLERTKR